jgi:hypothetical protein
VAHAATAGPPHRAAPRPRPPTEASRRSTTPDPPPRHPRRRVRPRRS